MSEMHIKDNSNDHAYFSILQNILSNIGLTAFERSLYWAIKECAGEKGSCTKSYAKLAKMSGMSEKSVKRNLTSLSKTNKFIGKSLIIINSRITEYGDQDTNEIIIIDLWEYNTKMFKKQIGQVTQTPPQVTQTPGVGSHRPQGGVTQTYHKDKEPSNKNPYKDPPPPPPKKNDEDDEDFKNLNKLIETAKQQNYPFTGAGIFSAFKETSYLSVGRTLSIYEKRSKNSAVLKYPDHWFKKECIKQHEYELQKEEYK